MTLSQEQHEVIVALKELAIRLGRSPKAADLSGSINHFKITKLFGSFVLAMQAAGLETAREARSKRLGNEIFERNIEKHVEEYSPAEPMPPPVYTKWGKYPKIMSISDIHWPFGNQPLIQAFIARAKEFQPEYIFINGDAWDMYAHSKYPRSHNVFTPRDEEQLSRKMNEEFWAAIRKACPKAKLVQMMGNHDIRPMKRVLEVYPAAEDWIQDRLNKLFTFEGVETIFDPRQEYLIGDIAVFHGHMSQLGAHRDYTLYNCINGHTHKGGAVFKQIRNTVLWELNSGIAGDARAKGLTYTPQKITHWTPGWAEVDPLGPSFRPWWP